MWVQFRAHETKGWFIMAMNLHFELEENEKIYFRFENLNLCGSTGLAFIFCREDLKNFRFSLIKISQFIDDETEFEFFIYLDEKVNGRFTDTYKSELFKGWKDIFFQISNLTFKYKE